MPNIKSAKKRVRISRKARTSNRSERARIRTAIKSVREAGSSDAAAARFREVQALLDRAATRRLLHPSRVARLKSQLARHVAARA